MSALELPLTVEERLARLEARLFPDPLALTPPITIGEMTNVPAPGSQLAAQWAQDASERVVHRFPNQAAVAAWTTAPIGTFAYQIDYGFLWRKVTAGAGGWSLYSPARYVGTGAVLRNDVVGEWVVNSLTISPDPGKRLASMSVSYRIELLGGYTSQITLYAAGASQNAVVVDTRNIPNTPTNYLVRHAAINVHGIDIPPNTSVVVETKASVGTAFTVQSSYTDRLNNDLTVLTYPKGVP